MQDLTSERQTAAISLRQLELFVAVGQLGAVQKAAKACALSQPAATQALAQLQGRVGAILLARGSVGTVLTSTGHMFYERAERIINAARAAIDATGADDVDHALRRLSPSQVRTLAAFLAAGSLEFAALATTVSPNAVRRSGRLIESQVGAVFSHDAHGMRLTTNGADFARRIVALHRELALAVREARAGIAEGGRVIVVGAAQAFGNRLLARVLAELGDAHPDARIAVLREGPDELVGRLRTGEVDLVVGEVEDGGADLVKDRLVKTPYHVFARPGHPLSRPGPLEPHDLAGYDWVCGMPGSVREAARARLFCNQLSPRVAFAASEGAIVGHFIAGSDRLALMTEHESRCGGVALAKLPFPPIECGLGIDVVRRATFQPSPLHEEFVGRLRSHLHPTAPQRRFEPHVALRQAS